MKQFSLYCLLTISIFVACLAAPTICAQTNIPTVSNEVLKLTPDKVDFGLKPQQKTFTSLVILKNQSKSQTVHILGVTSDCACTAGEPGLRTLAPGEQTELTIRIETRNYVGDIQRRVGIETNLGSYVLPVKFTVNPFGDWQLDPQIVSFPVGRVEQEQTFQLNAHYNGPETNARILSTWPDVPWLKAQFTADDTDPKLFHITLTRLAHAPSGNISGVVKLMTTIQANQELVVSVRAAVRADLTLVPNPIMLGATRVGQARTASFTVEGWKFDEPPAAIFPQGEVTFLGEEGGKLQYRVRLKPDKVGLINASILLLRPKTAQDQSNIDRTVAEVPVIIRVLPIEN